MKKNFSYLTILLVLLTSCNGMVQRRIQSLAPEPDNSTSCAFSDRMLPAVREGDQIVQHSHYTLAYSEADEQAFWVSYMLTSSRADGSVPRSNYFNEDPSVETGSATYYDYRKSGYSRGHLMPAGDAKWDTTAMKETFLMSNISPQLQDFNDGIWNRLEGRMRHWAEEYDTLYIVTGPVLKGLEEGQKRQIGQENHITVPEYFYKAVYCPALQQAIGFLVRHEQSRLPLQQFAVSIDQLEEATGLDFFPELEDGLENRIEAQADTKAWQW